MRRLNAAAENVMINKGERRKKRCCIPNILVFPLSLFLQMLFLSSLFSKGFKRTWKLKHFQVHVHPLIKAINCPLKRRLVVLLSLTVTLLHLQFSSVCFCFFIHEGRLSWREQTGGRKHTVGHDGDCAFGCKKKIYVNSTIELNPAKPNSPLLPACIVSA